MDFVTDPGVDAAAAPVNPSAALVKMNPDELRQLLGLLQSPQTPVAPTPPPPAPVTPPTSGVDWRKLIEQVGPILGAMAGGGNGTDHAAFYQGYQHGQAMVEQDRKAKADEAQKKALQGANWLMDVATHASQFDDPVQYENFVRLAETAGTKAGFIQPGELRDQAPFSSDKPVKKRLQEVSDQLDQLEKGGYNLDELAQSGSHLTLKDGTPISIAAAMQVTHRRPLDDGTPIPRPTKADSAPATDLDRFIARFAKDIGKNVNDLSYADLMQVKRDYEGKAETAVAKPPASETERAALLLQQIRDAKAKNDTGTASTLQTQYNDLLKAGADLSGSKREPKGSGEGLTDEGVDYAATQYRISGKMPALGLSSAGAKTAIINRAAKQAKELGQSAAVAIQQQAAYKADGAALTKMTTMSAAAESFEAKALQQADIVEQLSQKVSRTQYPIINGALLRGEKTILGDKDTQLLYNALTTFTTEYAKIMEGSTDSAAGSSESARRAAADLISPALNKGTLSATLDLMRREMRLTIQGYDATKAHITERMGGIPRTDTAPPPATPTKQTIGRFQVEIQ